MISTYTSKNWGKTEQNSQLTKKNTLLLEDSQLSWKSSNIKVFNYNNKTSPWLLQPPLPACASHPWLFGLKKASCDETLCLLVPKVNKETQAPHRRLTLSQGFATENRSSLNESSNLWLFRSEKGSQLYVDHLGRDETSNQA